MTFKSRELSVLAYANGFTLWHYRTGDPLDLLLDPATGAFEDAGYFGAACDLLCAGDQITVNLNGRPLPAIAVLVVQSVNPGGQVRVAEIGSDQVAPHAGAVPQESGPPPELAA